jgi:hypothetical protein
MGVSSKAANDFLNSIVEVFSQSHQAEMLSFLVKRKEEGDHCSSEGWFQAEIALKFGDSLSFKNKIAKGCDFSIDGLGNVELKFSTSFKYKSGNDENRLFGAMTVSHQNADYWLLISKYVRAQEERMKKEAIWKDFEYTIRLIEKPNPPWCAVLVWRKSPNKGKRQ